MCNRYTFIIVLLPVAKVHLKLTTKLLAFLPFFFSRRHSSSWSSPLLLLLLFFASLFGLEKHTVNRTVSEHFYLSKSAPNTKAWCDNRAINSCFTWSGWFFFFRSWILCEWFFFLFLLLLLFLILLFKKPKE